MFRSLFACALALTLFAGCSADVDVAPDEGPPIEEDAGALVTDTAVTNVDPNTPDLDMVRVRAGVLTVWVEPMVRSELRDGALVQVVRGHTSRKLTEFMTFIHDDGFAEGHILTPTSFEVVVRSPHELNSLLSGLPLFLRFVTASGTPNEHQAKLVIAPRFAKFDGPASVRFEAAIAPIALREGDDPLRYRGRVLTSQTPRRLTVDVDDGYSSMRVSPRAFRFDLTFKHLFDLTDTFVVVRAEFPSGEVRARAHVEFVVASLGLTTKSAERVWPREECSPDVDACVAAMGKSYDYASCGSYRAVFACIDPRTR